MQVFRSILARLGQRIRVRDESHEKRHPRVLSARRRPAKDEPPGGIRALEKMERGEAYGIEVAIEEEWRPMIAAALQQRIQQRADEIDRQRHVDCPLCSTKMRYKGRQVRTIHGCTGPITYRRCLYRCEPCGKTRYPADEAFGFSTKERWTPLALSRLVLLSALMTFWRAAETAGLFFGIKVTDNGVWKAVQRVGHRLLDRQEQEAAACESVTTCPDAKSGAKSRMIQVVPDGAMVLMRPGEGGRRGGRAEDEDPTDEGFRRCGGREVKNAVIGPAVKGAVGIRRVVSVLGSADELMRRVWAALVLDGRWDDKTVVVVIGDGAKWIWERATMFVNRIEILDFWHAVEHAWACARVLWGERTKRTAKWARRTTKQLRHGKVQEVVKALRRHLSGLPRTAATVAKRKALKDLITYYETHAHRMEYRRYRALGLAIGSGCVESAHRQIVHVRMRQAGMRWSVRGARHMIALREALVSRRWSDVEDLCGLKAA